LSWLRGISARSLRHIDRLEIDLAPHGKARRHLVLLGANGSGKTVLLDAIADELAAGVEGRAHPATELAAQPGNTETIDRDIRLAHFGRPVRLSFSQPAKLVRDAFASGKLIVAYLPDPRDTSIAPMSNAPTDTDPKKPRERTGARLLQFLAARRMEHELAKKSNDELRAKVHEAWFLRVQSTLRRLLKQPELVLGHDRDGPHLALPDGRIMHLDQLSRGHASAIAIWAELMMRVEAARMRNDDPSLDPNGVVVIDGVEGDLEVRLQRELLPALASLYPGVQLIVSTHSPLVALSLDDAIVFDLGARRARMSEDVRNGGVEGLLLSMLAPEDAPTVLSPSRHPPPMKPARSSPPPRSSAPPPAFTPPPHLSKAVVPLDTFRVPSAPPPKRLASAPPPKKIGSMPPPRDDVPSAPAWMTTELVSDSGEKTSPSIPPPEATRPKRLSQPPRAAPLPPRVPRFTEPSEKILRPPAPELESAPDAESLEDEPTSPKVSAPPPARIPPKKFQRKGKRNKKDTLTGSGPWAPEDD
jgi:predicted ATPase